jgi:hypothetical protein
MIDNFSWVRHLPRNRFADHGMRYCHGGFMGNLTQT